MSAVSVSGLKDALGRTDRARRVKQPRSLRPELATLVDSPPLGDDWIHELKYDGYRILAVLENGRARLVSRNDKDWTDRFRGVARAVETLPVERAIFDGEVVALTREGKSDFQALQNSLKGETRGDIVYYIFDLPFCEGWDLTRAPLLQRKELLAQVLAAEESRERATVHFSDHVIGRGDEVFRSACSRGLEGIVSKRADAPYESRRTKAWLKSKCLERQEFVIGGFTDPQGSRAEFGSLLVGTYDGDRLIYRGGVGTGFDERALRNVARELRRREVPRTPFAELPPGRTARGVHWVRPELVAEVEFSEWTADGILRHPSFKGLREDKAPRDVRREEARPRSSPRGRSRRVGTSSARVGRVAVSRPERVLWPDVGATKRELAEYWNDVAERALPHIAGRPLSLLRCPEGTGGECFWQKHRVDSMPSSIRGVELREDGETRIYVAIDDREGLLSLAQLGVLEIHPWGSRTDDLDRPDRIIFDLDPGPRTTWKDVTGAAHELREFLESIELASVARVTGGKGIHVVVPLVRRQNWNSVKRFAGGVARMFAKRAPRRFTASAVKARREGRIYIDWLRNARGATAIATWSPRARPGAPVAVPVPWEEVGPGLRPDGFDFDAARARARKEDPWAGVLSRRQSITPSRLRAVGESPPAPSS